MLAYAALCDYGGNAVEPFVAPMLPVFLERLADKVGRW
jgi:elongation factor 3